jgi:hypothetical protein
MDYFLQTKDGQSAGPYDLGQLRAFWRHGQITMDTPCWTALWGWKPIRHLSAQIEDRPVQGMPLSSPPQAAPRVKSESTVSKGFGMATGGCLFIITLIIGIPLLAVVAIVALCALVSVVSSSSDPALPSPETSAIYKASNDAEALQAAQKFVVGTWTYTTPNQFRQKWVIQGDGTALAYTANQNDKDWGEPHVYDWTVNKSTYSDTEEVLYAFHAKGRELSDGVLNASIQEDGSLSAVSIYDGSVYATLRRRDTAHFKGN